MLGVLGPSRAEDPGGSVALPDQLKALGLARRGVVVVSASVPGGSPASEGAWSDFSVAYGFSFDSLDLATTRSELAKNLQEKPGESKRGTSLSVFLVGFFFLVHFLNYRN